MCRKSYLDKREGRCYMEVEDRGGQRSCHHEMGSAVSKATCCCSVGKAWGSRCESCPAVETEEYKTLCPGGTGYRPNPTTVNNITFDHHLSCLLYIYIITRSLINLSSDDKGDTRRRQRVRGTRQPVHEWSLHQHVRELHVLVQRWLPP